MTTTVGATEFQRAVGKYTDLALAGEAVLITSWGRPQVVVVNVREYEDLIEARRQLVRMRPTRLGAKE